MGHPRPLFKQLLPQINVKNVLSVYGTGIQNKQPLEHESPAVTTKPGLPPFGYLLLDSKRSNLFSHAHIKVSSAFAPTIT